MEAANIGWRLACQRIVNAPGIGAKQPESLLREFFRLVLEVFSSKNHCCRAQTVAKVAIVPGVERESAAAVVVTQQRNGSVRPRQMQKKLRHS